MITFGVVNAGNASEVIYYKIYVAAVCALSGKHINARLELNVLPRFFFKQIAWPLTAYLRLKPTWSAIQARRWLEYTLFTIDYLNNYTTTLVRYRDLKHEIFRTEQGLHYKYSGVWNVQIMGIISVLSLFSGGMSHISQPFYEDESPAKLSYIRSIWTWGVLHFLRILQIFQKSFFLLFLLYMNIKMGKNNC